MKILKFKKIISILHDGLESKLESPIKQIEPIKLFSRPGSSVLFCRVRLSDSEELYIWAKTLNPSSGSDVKEKRIIRDYDLNQYLYDNMDQSGLFLVPRPLFYSPENRLIVTENMQGERLQDKIESEAYRLNAGKKRQDLKKQFYRAGEWLFNFQKITQDYCPGVHHDLELMKVKNLERIVEQTLGRIHLLKKENSNLIKEDLIILIKNFLLKNLENNQKNKEDYICSIHGDFFPGNLLFNKNAIIGIDFSSATWGSRYFDLSYFIFQIQTIENNLMYKKEIIQSAADSFLSGYKLNASANNFWSLNPDSKILYVSHSVSRLLSLAKKERLFFFRSTKKKLQFFEFIKRLRKHLKC